MKIQPSIKIAAPIKCLHCHEVLDGATGVETDRRRPVSGNASICMYCGHVAIFAEDMSLREPNDEEMHDLAGDPVILAIQHARGKVMRNK